MDFNDDAKLIEYMKEYLASHDISDADLMSLDSFEVTADPDEKIAELIKKDRYGERLGRYWNSISREPGFLRDNYITVYLRPDGLPGGIWNRIMGMIDCYEIFDYYDGYYVGTRYSFMMRNSTVLVFAFYVLKNGKVTEIIESIAPGTGSRYRLDRLLLGYEEDEAVLISHSSVLYEDDDGNLKAVKRADIFPGDTDDSPDEEPVTDDQKELCAKLKEAVKGCSDLGQIVEAFFDVAETAVPNPDADIEYAAGDNPYVFPGMEPECMFSLVRSTPTEEGEYYQLTLDVKFDLSSEEIPFDHMMDGGDLDLRKYVLGSKAFLALRDKKIKKVEVSLEET